MSDALPCYCFSSVGDACPRHGGEVKASGNALPTHHASNPGATGAGVASVPTVDAAAILAAREHYPGFSGFLYPTNEGPLAFCARCRAPWRGDAETGGCDAVLLARRVIELEG